MALRRRTSSSSAELAPLLPSPPPPAVRAAALRALASLAEACCTAAPAAPTATSLTKSATATAAPNGPRLSAALLFDTASAAATDGAAECRELAAQLFWHAAQLQENEAPPHAPLACFEQLGALVSDSSAAVRRRACALLPSVPRVDGALVGLATSKRVGGAPKPPGPHRAGGAPVTTAMDLCLLVGAQTAEAAAAAAAAEGAEGRPALEEAAAGALILALEDECSSVRYAAVGALTELVWRDGAQQQEEERGRRRRVKQRGGGGGGLGAPPAAPHAAPHASRAISLLVDASGDEDAAVRRHALGMLSWLGGGLRLNARQATAVGTCAREPAAELRTAALRLLGGVRLEDKHALAAARAALALCVSSAPAEADAVRRCASRIGQRNGGLVLGQSKTELVTLASQTPSQRGGGWCAPPSPEALVAAEMLAAAEAAVAARDRCKSAASASAAAAAASSSSSSAASGATPHAAAPVRRGSTAWIAAAIEADEAATADAAAAAAARGTEWQRVVADASEALRDGARSLRAGTASAAARLLAAAAERLHASEAGPCRWSALRLDLAWHVARCCTMLQLPSCAGAEEIESPLPPLARRVLAISYEMQYAFAPPASAHHGLHAARLWAHAALYAVSSAPAVASGRRRAVAPEQPSASAAVGAEPAASVALLRLRLATAASCAGEGGGGGDAAALETLRALVRSVQGALDAESEGGVSAGREGHSAGREDDASAGRPSGLPSGLPRRLVALLLEHAAGVVCGTEVAETTACHPPGEGAGLKANVGVAPGWSPGWSPGWGCEPLAWSCELQRRRADGSHLLPAPPSPGGDGTVYRLLLNGTIEAPTLAPGPTSTADPPAADPPADEASDPSSCCLLYAEPPRGPRGVHAQTFALTPTQLSRVPRAAAAAGAPGAGVPAAAPGADAASSPGRTESHESRGSTHSYEGAIRVLTAGPLTSSSPVTIRLLRRFRPDVPAADVPWLTLDGGGGRFVRLRFGGRRPVASSARAELKRPRQEPLSTAAARGWQAQQVEAGEEAELGLVVRRPGGSAARLLYYVR